MKNIKIYSETHGAFNILVDEDDFDRLSVYKWGIRKIGKNFYAYRNIKKNTVQECIYLHRFIMRLKKGVKLIVDHKNRDTLDNRKSNLRICSRSQNNANSIPKRDRKLKGVYPGPHTKKFVAAITVNNKTIGLGSFIKQEDAATAYNQAALKYFGEFAKLNEL